MKLNGEHKAFSTVVLRLRTGVFLITVLSAVLLCLSMIPSQFAFADELDDAWAELSAKTAEIEGLTAQLSEARENMDANQKELEAITGSIAESQEKLAGVQKRLASTSRLMYKSDDLSIWQIITSSNSIDQLIFRIIQLEAVASQAAVLSAEEKRYQEELADDYAEATKRKDAAQEAANQLEQTKEAIEASAAALEEHIAQLEEEKALAQAAAEAAAALEAAQRAAEEAAAVQQAQISNPYASTEQVADGLAPDEGAASEVFDEAGSDNQVEESPEPEPEPEPQSETTLEAQPSGDTSGWMTGIASAYGGSSDASTPNPGTTATGAVCDDYSTGVAVPIAWGPSDYYGRMVEISYNGMTVVATVNDCGGMGGGSRHLDLQPGVFKAFGFSTCQEWGLREVSYRFL
ncbi:MAG: hypothetical protein IJ113_02620 [Eggerthellaceae bacterium]|nr:hypothetical protein [Eggerthellaceae bacterium]